MDAEKKEQKTKHHSLEILRYLFYAVVVVFLFSCILSLFLEYLEMKQRLVVMDGQMRTLKLTLDKLSATSSSGKTGNNDGPDVEYLPARRTRREVTLTLQSLERRLKVLETRYVYTNNI